MSNEEYRQKITKLINKIEDNWILEQIFKFIFNMTKERV
jgi:hypothetical protein|nr:MAG TPA: hypothetical protein [Bacteriophage sp.]